MKISPNISLSRLRMPHTSKFVCYADDEAILHATMFFDGTTKVKKIEFELENLNSETFKMVQVKLCEERDLKTSSNGKRFIYRVMLIQDADSSQNSAYTLETQELGKLDFINNNEAHFFFNIIDNNDVNYYLNNCDYNTNKPRTKDGYIIVSI